VVIALKQNDLVYGWGMDFKSVTALRYVHLSSTSSPHKCSAMKVRALSMITVMLERHFDAIMLVDGARGCGARRWVL
jgi:hypothetical protein